VVDVVKRWTMMGHLTFRNIASALTIAAGLAVATPASAELLFFSDAQSMSIAGHRIEGDRVIVTLRGGGEMAVDSARVAKILPDEVAYPQPSGVAEGRESPESVSQLPAVAALPVL